MNDPAAAARRGEELMSLKRYDEAAREFLEARTMDPDSADISFNLGLARLKDGRPRDALAFLGEALELGGEAPDLLADLGLALFELGRTQEAETRYRRALELEPGHPEAANNLGVIMFQHDDLEAALRLFTLATSSRPEYYEAWFNLRDTCDELLARPGTAANGYLAALRDDAASRAEKLEGRQQ